MQTPKIQISRLKDLIAVPEGDVMSLDVDGRSIAKRIL
jgi:hypothetical protein